MLDPLGVVTKTRSTQDDLEEKMAEAPSTIVQGEELERHSKENLSYRPGLGNVPDLELPSNLPELVGKYQIILECTNI